MSNILPTPAPTDASKMAKIRTVDGLQLPDNLYTTPRKETGKWRYKRPDGSFYTFAASTADAIEAAKGLNAQFAGGSTVKAIANPQYGRLTIRRHVEDFINEREQREPSLKSKTIRHPKRRQKRLTTHIIRHSSMVGSAHWQCPAQPKSRIQTLL